MSPHSLELPTPRETAALGAAVAAGLRLGEAVCLSGPLGAGKSVLARGMVRSLTTPEEEVPSPTFTLVQTYAAPAFTLAHFDLYRLTDPEEAWELGLDEALETGAAVIEWPERLGGRLPAHRLEISLSPSLPGEGRVARLEGFGSWVGRVDRLLRPPLPDACA